MASYDSPQPLSTNELWIDSTNRTINVFTLDRNKIGDHLVKITVRLVRGYTPPVETTFDLFKVTINPCIVTSLTMQDLSPTFDQTYTIADPEKEWEIVADTTLASTVVTQVPACGYI